MRNIATGAFVQMIKEDVRAVRYGLKEQGMLVAAMSGGRTDDGIGKERLVELVYNGQ